VSIGGIGSSTGIRVSISQSITRQTPKTDFGSQLKSGLSKGADLTLQAAHFTPSFQGILDGVGDLESYLRKSGGATQPKLNALLGEISTLKAQLNRIVMMTKKP